MARKDDILKSFLEHDVLKEYEIEEGLIPHTVREALDSNIPIIKAIALIVDKLESPQAITDRALRNLVTQYLNEAAI